MTSSSTPNGHQAAIVTLTMNPALDITTSADQVRPTDKIRCHGVRYDPGGGGINVARIARVLGASVEAVFPAGGMAGDMIVELLKTAGVPLYRVRISGSTRESFTVNERDSGKQYRFVLPGPQLTFAERAQCLDELRRAACSAQFVVASGSLPPGVPADLYQTVADICCDIGVKLVLDTSGCGLLQITSGVFLLKVSVRELRECVGRKLASESEQVAAAQELLQRGLAEAIVVSCGSKGAFLITAGGSQHFSAIKMRSGSGVGAGDAMVAAITVGLSRRWQLAESVRYGLAAGAAMLMTPGTAACTRDDVERLLQACRRADQH